MVKPRAKAYSREFREEVLRLAANSDRSDAEIEEGLGLSPQLISQWRRRYGVPSGEPAGTSKPTTLTEAEAEIRQLKRELEVVRQERDILKKAVAIFSKERLP
jgi:transposase